MGVSIILEEDNEDYPTFASGMGMGTSDIWGGLPQKNNCVWTRK